MAAHVSSCDQVADSPWDERPVQREMPWVRLRVFQAHVSAPSNCVSVACQVPILIFLRKLISPPGFDYAKKAATQDRADVWLGSPCTRHSVSLNRRCFRQCSFWRSCHGWLRAPPRPPASSHTCAASASSTTETKRMCLATNLGRHQDTLGLHPLPLHTAVSWFSSRPSSAPNPATLPAPPPSQIGEIRPYETQPLYLTCALMVGVHFASKVPQRPERLL